MALRVISSQSLFDTDLSKDDGGELGRLMHDFRVKEAKEMQAGALKDRVHELKETEKGVEHMCKEMEALRLEGVEEGRLEEKRENAKSMQASYLWKKLFTKKHLIEHYEEKVKNKPSVGLDKVSPRKFEQNLDENIEIIIRKSMNDSYHFTRYKQLF